jgi:4a-hydroxytetrahydrobiopterin dehydratase
MPLPKLSEAEISTALASLKGWSDVDGKLHREYRFADFVHAFGFMATASMVIEKLNHHPEWFNVWNRVTIDLVTHDSAGITKKDIELATLLEGIATKMM